VPSGDRQSCASAAQGNWNKGRVEQISKKEFYTSILEESKGARGQHESKKAKQKKTRWGTHS